MTEQPIVANPIGWVQVRLLGGWKRLVGFIAGYAGIVFLLHIFAFRAAGFNAASVPQFADVALNIMTFAEAAILLIGGTAAIKKAIHRDFTTDIIGSHRMTMMTGHAAVMGYLTGSTAQVLLITLVNWVICTALALLAGASGSPLGPSGLLVSLICLAALFWTFAVLAGLSTKGAFSVIGVVVAVSLVLRLPVLEMLPGLALLFRSGTTGMTWSVNATSYVGVLTVVSMAAQLAFALIFFAAASRKFSRDDVIAFTPALAYVLLALCTLLSAVGLAYWEPVTPSPRFFSLVSSGSIVELVVTLPALALVACLVVAVSAKNSARWARRKALDPGYAAPKPRLFLEAPVAATFLVFAILVVVLAQRADLFRDILQGERAAFRLASIVVAFLLALSTLAGLLRVVYAYSEKGTWVLILYLVAIWIVPLLVDLAIRINMEESWGESSTLLMGFSPIGTWWIASGQSDATPVPGLVFQGILAVGSLLLVRRARR
jgi:hypothetical protein